MLKYLNPKNYTRRSFQIFNRYALEHVETQIALDPDLSLRRHPPIFFLGAPRSGSTLAVQVITDTLDVGYISNRHCQWFGAPALAERLFHPTQNRPKSDYRSNHGSTKGSYAPAECGEWWYRFFRKHPAYVTLQDVDEVKMRHFRQSVAALTNAYNKPILFKNLYASLRIQAIAHYLPESLFIIIHRDEVDNSHSLLETRKTVFGVYDKWWSMEPPSTEFLKQLPVHQQVVEQIRHIHATIKHDLKAANVLESRRFHLCYEDFCANPSTTIKALQEFVEEHGCRMIQRGTSPDSFKRRDVIKIDKMLYTAMEEYARRS